MQSPFSRKETITFDKSAALSIAQVVDNLRNTAVLLAYDTASTANPMPQKHKGQTFSGIVPNGTYALLSSNTVMAVAPDSNRIPFCIYSADSFSNRIFRIFNFIQYTIKFLQCAIKCAENCRKSPIFYKIFYSIPCEEEPE